MLADGIVSALYAPEAGVVSPYQLAIALADRAAVNGVEVLTEAPVTALTKEDGVFVVETPKGESRAKTRRQLRGRGRVRSQCDARRRDF